MKKQNHTPDKRIIRKLLRRSIAAVLCASVCLSAPGVSALAAFSSDYFSDAQWSFDNHGSYTHFIGLETLTLEAKEDIDLDIPEGWTLYNELVSSISEIGNYTASSSAISAEASDTDGQTSPGIPELTEYQKKLLSFYEAGSPEEVIVAVIDTGIDFSHPDLSGSMWANVNEIPDNGIDDDGNGYIDDLFGWDFYNNDNTICHYSYHPDTGAELSNPDDCDDHGTHVAGIIAATANNNIGIAGVAGISDKVKIMSLKIHGGEDRRGAISDAVKAIRYAEANGAKICNISWGSYVHNKDLYNAIAGSNMLFICAAGNDGANNDEKPLYPASFDLPNVISVGYTDRFGSLAQNSNYGKENVDVAVPAVDIFSTVVGSYKSMAGSSMAAPEVTGLAAMIFTLSNGLSTTDVKRLIIESCKKEKELSGKVVSDGIPSLALIMENAVNTLVPDLTAPSLSITRAFDASNILLELTPGDNIPNNISTIRYFIGRKKAEDFKNGSAGTLVSGNTLSLNKAGFYTFYVTDTSGNHTLKQYLVTDDLVAPTIKNASYKVSKDYSTISISCTVSDIGSGLKTVKYLPGKRTAQDFLSSGTRLEFDSEGQIGFDVDAGGVYTVYTADYRGNKTTKYVYAYIRKATDIALDRKTKTMRVGKTYTLSPVLTPSNSTDVISYKSSNKAVAKVNKSGKITAVSVGKATITATTASGKKASIIITVKPAN